MSRWENDNFSLHDLGLMILALKLGPRYDLTFHHTQNEVAMPAPFKISLKKKPQTSTGIQSPRKHYSRLCLIRPNQNTNFLYELIVVTN